MNILLLSPASREDRQQRNKYVTYAPLTLPMLAALSPPDCDIQIVDEKVEAIDFDLQPDLVGITAITGTANRSYEVARQFREKGCTVVMGGPHPTVRPEEALEHADSVVTGQAYESWPRCIKDYRRGRLREMYLDDGAAIKVIPTPRRELLKGAKYITRNSVQATVGCPNSCDFCVVSRVFGERFMVREVEQVIAEIERLSGPYLFFLDVNLTADGRFAKELFRRMVPLRKKWAAQVTTEFAADPEMLDLAARSGCIGVFIGAESLNQRSLDSANKSFNSVEFYAEMQRKLRHHGICSMMGIVYGFDEDDPSIFDKTMLFMDRIRADSVRYGILTPFPGTRLFHQMERENRIIDYNWDHYDSSNVVFRPRRMSPEQLRQGFMRSMNHTYSMRSMITRVFGSNAYLPLSIAVNYGYYSEAKRLFRQHQRGGWRERIKSYLPAPPRGTNH